MLYNFLLHINPSPNNNVKAKDCCIYWNTNNNKASLARQQLIR
jgi:hypothetical protein